MSEFKQGDRVRFTADQLGTIRKDGSGGTKFTEVVVQAGDLGTVEIAPGTMPDGWLAVTPDVDESLYVPVHPFMVERVPQ